MKVLTVGPWRHPGVIAWSHYAETGENSIRIVSEDGEPIAVATACLHPPAPRAPERMVWLKGWSENDGLPQALEHSGVVELLPVYHPTGHVQAQLAKLTPAALAELRLAYANNPQATADRERARLAVR